MVFRHRPSRTVIFADLIENFTDPFLREHWSGWRRSPAKIAGMTSVNPHAPPQWRLAFVKRAPARATRGKKLGWDRDLVVMAQGEWRCSDGRAFVTRAIAWLDP